MKSHMDNLEKSSSKDTTFIIIVLQAFTLNAVAYIASQIYRTSSSK